MMKTIVTYILGLLLVVAVASAEDSSVAVAKVDYGQIEDLLVKVVLSADENAELRDRYEAKTKAAREAQEKIQAAIMKGESLNPEEAARSFLHDDGDEEEVEQRCQKRLLEIIEKTFAGKYDLVFKEDYGSSLLYTKAAIDDVTMIIKQELLKELPERREAVKER